MVEGPGLHPGKASKQTVGPEEGRKGARPSSAFRLVFPAVRKPVPPGLWGRTIQPLFPLHSLRCFICQLRDWEVSPQLPNHTSDRRALSLGKPPGGARFPCPCSPAPLLPS